MTRLIILITVMFSLGACASTTPEPQVAANTTTGDTVEAVTSSATSARKDDGLVCKRVRVTGSNRTEKVCRFQSDIDRDREQAQRTMREAQKKNPVPINN